MSLARTTAALFLLCWMTLAQSADVQVTLQLKTTRSWNGSPIVYPRGEPEMTGLLIELAPGGETGWHAHPAPSFAWVLEGELEISLADGSVKRVKAGEAVAEVIDTMHNGRSVGKAPVKLLVVYMGAVGQSLTETRR
jgi:quercetin dioxygenase-like cupin family protein